MYIYIHDKCKTEFNAIKMGENNKRFDLTLFQEDTIRIVFDALHGIDNEEARDEFYLQGVCSNANHLKKSILKNSRSCRIMNFQNIFLSLSLS